LPETDAMTLDPSSYGCPEHHTVLTGLVTEALADDDPPVAYFRLGVRPTTSPFQVIVTCPGLNGAGAHQITFSGTRSQ
jgi:hypothetical protein